MSYSPITTLSSRLIAMPASNVDTDQIIPARFLKATDRRGFGANLFFDWRYMADGSLNPDFVLNIQGNKGEILLAGPNFGCGSSREHAAWALYDFGFRVVISSGFADIFRNNAMNNGLLPIEVSPEQLAQLFSIHKENPTLNWTVDLEKQELFIDTLSSTENSSKTKHLRLKIPLAYRVSPIIFHINPFRKQCLLNGLDLVDYLVSLKPSIEAYENQRIKKNKVLSWSLL